MNKNQNLQREKNSICTGEPQVLQTSKYSVRLNFLGWQFYQCVGFFLKDENNNSKKN